ncbi:MAG: hypothetical protein IPG98_11300 [Burkholderiales bacterium]|nr:hypothetical protein [Burkholderiales bacterium]
MAQIQKGITMFRCTRYAAWVATVASLMLASAGPASAQGKAPTPTDNLKVQVSINPANASPGDTVQKTIRLINEFDQPQNIVNFVDSLRSMGVGFVVNGSPTITPSPSCTGIGKGSMSAPNGGSPSASRVE